MSMDASKAYFMVRAEVANEADRDRFDRWYGEHHVPLAMAYFKSEKAWRFWSRLDPAVHYAMYQFPDMATLHAVTGAPGFKALVDDFNDAWPSVPRSRDLLETVQAV
jgi:hypothetical protein